MIYYRDIKYNFVEAFNEHNGLLIRSNTLCGDKETASLPEMRSFPELLDIGIMGHCSSGKMGLCKAAGVDCYQNGPSSKRPNMAFEDYQRIISQCEGLVFQIALGGAGDPNKHERFESILSETRNRGIVPNLTTSGYSITDDEIRLIKDYCGAVAVSYYTTLDTSMKETNPVSTDAVARLVNAGCITNIHYTISKANIDEAIVRVKNDLFPHGINAVVFLLYKAVGLGRMSNVLTYRDRKYHDFLEAISNYPGTIKMGFDACQSPALLNSLMGAAPQSIEYCEAARFSMYIDASLTAYPCSFAIDSNKYAVDLTKYSIKEAWRSDQFNAFKSRQKRLCSGCKRSVCRNCALDIGIDLCGNLER